MLHRRRPSWRNDGSGPRAAEQGKRGARPHCAKCGRSGGPQRTAVDPAKSRRSLSAQQPSSARTDRRRSDRQGRALGPSWRLPKRSGWRGVSLREARGIFRHRRGKAGVLGGDPRKHIGGAGVGVPQERGAAARARIPEFGAMSVSDGGPSPRRPLWPLMNTAAPEKEERSANPVDRRGILALTHFRCRRSASRIASGSGVEGSQTWVGAGCRRHCCRRG